MEQAVKKIFDRSMYFKRANDGSQYRVRKEDLPLICEIFNNKKLSIKEAAWSDGVEGTWLLRNVTLPVTLKDNYIYFGDSLKLDIDKLYWTTTIGKSNALTGEPIRACGIQLWGVHFDGIYHDENGNEVVLRMPDATTKTYFIYRTIGEAKDLMEYEGVNYDGAYYVTADGYVFSNKASMKTKLTPLAPGYGGKKPYKVIVLNDKHGKSHTVNLHRLIAVMFVPNDDPINKTQVNHRDLNPRNNAADNLEWCTRAYNLKYSPVFRALKKGLSDIDCRKWLDTCHDLTERVLDGEELADLVAETVKRFLTNKTATVV